MNRVKFLVVAGLAVVALSVIGCNDDGGSKVNGSTSGDNPFLGKYAAHEASAQTLKENTWKLAGIVDAKTDSLTKLEPANCEECYTLTFDTDTTFSSFSSVNSSIGKYSYEKHSFRVTEHLGTEINELGDGRQWSDILWTVDAFSLLENGLKLYYNEYQNYLLFISQ